MTKEKKPTLKLIDKKAVYLVDGEILHELIGYLLGKTCGETIESVIYLTNLEKAPDELQPENTEEEEKC